MMLQIGDKVDLSLKGCEVVGVNRSHDGKQLVYSVVTPKGHVWNILVKYSSASSSSTNFLSFSWINPLLGEDSLPEAMVIKDVS
jgi:hypothetical protein